MNASFTRRFALLSLVSMAAFLATQAQADPLPKRDLLKFSQLPELAVPLPDPNGTVTTYHGHDELSTAYGNILQPGSPVLGYTGRFMADDFADKLNTPVLHVKFWGSYLNNFIDPNMQVNKFLISFESDQPANSANGFSHPDVPLLTQIVTRGALAPSSGTFTEKPVPGITSVDGPVYEYNAELNLNNAFPEKADNVYWLKITALVDLPVGFSTANPSFDPLNPGASPTKVTQWGWHNRDFTVQDTLASTAVSPGESIVGLVGNAASPVPVWHFQDDAVAGKVRVNMLPPGTPLNPTIQQQSLSATNYVDGLDGPGIAGATHNISSFSKDLAFELYTNNPVPEPGTCLLLISGCVGLALMRRKMSRG